MYFVRRTFDVLLALLLLSNLSRGEDPTSRPDVSEQALIDCLSDADVHVRGRAIIELWNRGKTAADALKEATKSPNETIRKSSKELLDRFTLTGWPNFPEKYRKVIMEFASGDRRSIANEASTESGIRDLPVTLEFVRTLIAIETALPIGFSEKRDDDYSAKESLRVLGNLRRLESDVLVESALALVLEGKIDKADELLVTHLRDNTSIGQNLAIETYLAVQALQGEQAIRRVISEWEKKTDSQAAQKADRILGYFKYWLGDYVGAAAHFEKATDADNVRRILLQTGQWKKLLEYNPDYDFGRTAEFIPEYKQLIAYVAGDSSIPADKLWRKQAVLNPFVKSLRQERFEDAWLAAKSIGELHPRIANFYQTQQAVALYFLGERDSALKIVGKTDPKIFGDKGPDFFTALMDKARELNRPSLGRMFSAEGKKLLGDDVYSYWDRDRRGNFQIWIELLKGARSKLSITSQRKLLDDLFSNQLPAQDQIALCNDLLANSRNGWPLGMMDRWPPRMISDILHDNGHYEAAWKIHEQNLGTEVGPEHLNSLVDMAVEKKDWDKAIKLIDSAKYKRFTIERLWKKGWILEQSGKVEEGRKLQEQAVKLLPFDFSAPYHLAEIMTAAGRNQDLIAILNNYAKHNLNTFVLGYTGVNPLRSEDAEERGDYVSAWKIVVSSLNYSSSDISPFDFHRLRALAALNEKKIINAVAEADRAQEMMPGEIKLIVKLVPGLDKFGETKAADTLFERVWNFNVAILKDYPNSVIHHQRLAIMAKVCGRHGAEGKQHAEMALKLDPEDAAFKSQVGPAATAP